MRADVMDCPRKPFSRPAVWQDLCRADIGDNTAARQRTGNRAEDFPERTYRRRQDDKVGTGYALGYIVHDFARNCQFSCPSASYRTVRVTHRFYAGKTTQNC